MAEKPTVTIPEGEAPTDLLANYPTLSGDAKTYAAMLESLDIAIGRILSELTAQRLDANTVVVFYSDNGGPGNSVARNTPLRGSKTGVYEGGIRVPAIIRQPGVIRAGVTSDQFTTVQDLFPTLAAAEPYVNQPQKLAEKVYGDRFDNRPGDGWRYRGRGFVQITGRSSYREMGRKLGIPLEDHPELALDPKHALAIACEEVLAAASTGGRRTASKNARAPTA